jgi:aspartate carbamoyltransferase
MNNLLEGKDIIHSKQFNREELELIMDTALTFDDKLDSGEELKLLSGKILGALFFEPSTRTRLSFETAMQRLGGTTVSIADPKTSSATKGESMKDSIRTVQGYADVIAMRHPEVGSAARAAEAARVPIMNGGDGAGQHPTQALLDMYTIKQEKGALDGMTISLVGDLKNGRTVHSLGYLLAHYDVKLNLIAPKELAFPSAIITELEDMDVEVEEYERMEEPLKETDVCYMTRIQQERFEDPKDYEALKGVYVLDMEKVKNAKDGITIMHPLPRVDEIPEEVDEYEGAAYFRQAENGVPVRMALIALVLGKVNG